MACRWCGDARRVRTRCSILIGTCKHTRVHNINGCASAHTQMAFMHVQAWTTATCNLLYLLHLQPLEFPQVGCENNHSREDCVIKHKTNAGVGCTNYRRKNCVNKYKIRAHVHLWWSEGSLMHAVLQRALSVAGSARAGEAMPIIMHALPRTKP